MKKLLNATVSLFIVGLIIFFFVRYITKNIADFKKILLVSPFYIMLLTLTFLVTIWLSARMMDLMLRGFGLKLKKWENIGLVNITNFYNTITPFRGGAAIRAIYLKKKYNFNFTGFLSVFPAVYIVLIVSGSILGILGLVLAKLFYNQFNLLIFLFLLSITLLTLIIAFFIPKLSETKYSLLNKIIYIINGWQIIKKNKSLMFKTTLIALMQFIFIAISYNLAYSSIGYKLPFIYAIIITSINSLALLIAITPGNLGISEIINVFVANLIKIPVIESVLAMLIWRITNVLLILLLGMPSTYLLLKFKKLS
ncbi:flippase-like domain-containing protein [Candidatus Woesearchaeota archaeon]|nr:flippase-like domain-containing protein [Candidatus Woesearchaeota archaeon]